MSFVKNQKVMKNIIVLLSLFMIASTVTLAQNKEKSSKGAEQKTIYTCSMHPEIMSSKKGNCPKCGMKLIEKVTKNSVSTKENQTNAGKAKIYACPMHPESKGKLNDKCPKCGMKLTVEVK